MERKALTGFFVTIAATLATPAFATIEFNKVVAHLGTQDSFAYVVFAVPPTGSCAYNNVYIDLTTDKGKAAYATVLTAYVAGLTVSRVDYTNTSGTCYVNLIEI